LGAAMLQYLREWREFLLILLFLSATILPAAGLAAFLALRRRIWQTAFATAVVITILLGQVLAIAAGLYIDIQRGRKLREHPGSMDCGPPATLVFIVIQLFAGPIAGAATGTLCAFRVSKRRVTGLGCGHQICSRTEPPRAI
jgi:hypothetical protein